MSYELHSSLFVQAQCLSEYRSGALALEARHTPAHACLVDIVCRPGNTLLWDLVQDGNIVSCTTCLPLYYAIISIQIHLPNLVTIQGVLLSVIEK